MYGVETRIEIGGDRDLFKRLSNTLRNPRELLESVGALGFNSAARRLEHVLKDDGLRSGLLAGSLNVDAPGGGTEHTIFELSDHSVTVGSNLPYAAQVNFGGTILPKNAKALAIPLADKLKRSGEGPRDIDPTREILRFQPYTGSKPNIFGLLIDDGAELVGRQRKRRGRTVYGPGPLFALAYWVTQEPRPYLFWSDEDARRIEDELIPAWLGL